MKAMKEANLSLFSQTVHGNYL